jgi:hypothetical protein
MKEGALMVTTHVCFPLHEIFHWDCLYQVERIWQGKDFTVDTKKRELLKCVLAAMYRWQHCGTGTLRYNLAIL